MKPTLLKYFGLLVMKYAVAAFALFLCSLVANAAEGKDSASGEKSGVKYLDAKQAQSLIAEKKVIVLDIRTPEEFKSGHIAGATNVNYRSPDFDKTISGLDKSKSYIVHCAVGGRSTASLTNFKKHGFNSIYHLDGGITGWEKAGLPLDRDKK